MTRIEIIDEIINKLDPEDVPIEYIVMAKITDFQGNERIVRGKELSDLLRNPDLHQIAEARVILNVKKIRKAILDEINAVFDAVNRAFGRGDAPSAD